jgi:hypothetical protein
MPRDGQTRGYTLFDPNFSLKDKKVDDEEVDDF